MPAFPFLSVKGMGREDNTESSMMRCVLVLTTFALALPVQAADLAQIPAIVAGKKAKGADWKAAAKLEKIVQEAAKKAGHNLTAMTGDAGKKALACKGNVDCLAKIASGKSGYAVVIVVWALKKKRLGEVALYDLASMTKIGGANGAIDDKLGTSLVAAIPAPPPEPEPEPEPEAPVEVADASGQGDQNSDEATTQASVSGSEKPAEAPKVAEAPESSEASNALSYVLIGAGVAMVGGGTYFGLNALDYHSQLGEPLSEADRSTKEEEMKSAALTADLLMFPGIAAAGAGAYLMFVE